MAHYHAVVWLDHREARVFQFNADEVEKTKVEADNPHVHIHTRAGAPGPGHVNADEGYLAEVVAALSGAQKILLTGPGRAKHELHRFMERKAPDAAARVVAVETVDHPSDGQLVAHARHYFAAYDRTQPQR